MQSWKADKESALDIYQLSCSQSIHVHSQIMLVVEEVSCGEWEIMKVWSKDDHPWPFMMLVDTDQFKQQVDHSHEINK